MGRTTRIVTFTAIALLLSTEVVGASTFASTPRLSAELLSVSQMPIGWSTDNSSSGNGVGCLTTLLEPKGIKQTSHASITLDVNGNTPLVSEKLATYSNAKIAYKKIVAILSRCKHVSGTSGGIKATGIVGEMSFPHYGNASAAFSVSLVIQGTTIDDDLLIVRKVNVVMGIEEADAPPVDISQFQGFIVRALANVK